MNSGFRQLFTVLACILLAINVPAQDIPVLPGDPAVLKGVMPNGMSYYIVSNPSEKGVADFALVQKTGTLVSDDGKVSDAAEDAFLSLMRIGKSRLKNYLRNHEIIPGKEGFIEVSDDATTFRFNNVRLNIGKNAIDSTLMIMMDIADRANYSDDEFIRKWYSPADQAIIISGDVDSKSLASRLLYMSYMIPSGESHERPEYVREESHVTGVSEKNGIATVSATWMSKRVPRKLMNTVQPEIFEMSLNTLGAAAVNRIRKYLKAADVPVADVSYDHMCSSEYPYDDSFTLNVSVRKEDVAKAEDAMAAVMSSIDQKGLMTNEFVFAEFSYMQSLVKDADNPLPSNRDYVERCRNAYLYNASLASPKERLAFHTSRDIPDTMRQRLINGIASALIDTIGLREPAVPDAFTDILGVDTLLKMDLPLRMKLKTVRKEPVSGGSIWTFANGFKVIYKKMASDRMYYSLALNGGYGGISGLDAGEGAYMSDYLKTCRVAGMDEPDFIAALGREGISMDVNVGLSNMMVNGNLPDDKMILLLRSLLALANERTGAEAEDVDYYKQCEYLGLDYAQGSFEARLTAIDSIMCPGYMYSPYKIKGKISDGYKQKAEKYFESQFSKMNDGVLVLVGDMNEDNLKKILMDYAGGFRTADVVSRKPVVRYQPVSGWSTYTVEGDYDNVDVTLSTRIPITMDNYAAANIASMIVKREIARKLNESGLYFMMSENFRIYPEERFNALISIPSATLGNLSSIRVAVAGLQAKDITADELKPYKEALKSRMAREMKSPEYWIHAIALRYLDGKDLSTNYAARIDAVTPERVKSVMKLLNDGSKIEYITIGKNR